jgi:hypothetical protein
MVRAQPRPPADRRRIEQCLEPADIRPEERVRRATQPAASPPCRREHMNGFPRENGTVLMSLRRATTLPFNPRWSTDI